MVHIEQNQKLATEPNIRVAVPTGDYNETDLIECYQENGGDIRRPTCMYQAQFVVFGGMIYHQSEELTENQVAALVAGTPIDQVINNAALMVGKLPAAKFVGRICTMSGPIGARMLRTDIVDPGEPPIIQTPPDDSQSMPPDNTQSTTTPSRRKKPQVSPTPAAPIDIAPIAPPDVLGQPNLSTPIESTDGIAPLSNPASGSDTGTGVDTNTTGAGTSLENEIVAYAKRKIAKRLKF